MVSIGVSSRAAYNVQLTPSRIPWVPDLPTRSVEEPSYLLKSLVIANRNQVFVYFEDNNQNLAKYTTQDNR